MQLSLEKNKSRKKRGLKDSLSLKSDIAADSQKMNVPIQKKIIDSGSELTDPKAVYDMLFDDDYWEIKLNVGWEPIEENIVDIIEQIINDDYGCTLNDVETFVWENYKKYDLLVYNDPGELYGGAKGGWGYPKDKDQTKTGLWGTLTLHNDSQGCLDDNKGFNQAGVKDYGAGTGFIYDVRKAQSFTGLVASRAMHFKWANELAQADGKKAGEGNQPPVDCTWHHRKQTGEMQLLDRELHKAFKHKGGYSLWGS